MLATVEEGGLTEEELRFLALHDTARAGIRVAALRLASAVVGFMASVFIARALGPAGRGLYAFPLAVVSIVLALSHMGLEHANVYLAARRVDLRRLWANSSLVAVFAGGLAWATLASAYAVVGGGVLGGVPLSWMVLGLIQMPLLLQALYWTNVLQLAERFLMAVRAALIGSILSAVVTAVLFLTHALTPFRALLLWLLANVATWGLLLWLGLRAGLASVAPDWRALREGIVFGLKAYVGVTFFFLLLRIDQILVRGYLGFGALGLYSLAVSLSESLWRLTDTFAASLLPHQVRAAPGDERRLGDATARMSLVVAVVLAVVAWLAAPYAIRIAYGAKFDEMLWAFRWLLPGVVALSIQRPMGAVIVKEGRIWLVSYFGAAVLAVNVALNLALLSRIGIVGASIASSVTYVALALLYVAATRQKGVAEWKDLRPRGTDVSRLWLGLTRR
ncbi:MAG: polysaccharide biosynthesis C-terminal domain-containing protein [Actinomycetota bacterium]